MTHKKLIQQLREALGDNKRQQQLIDSLYLTRQSQDRIINQLNLSIQNLQPRYDILRKSIADSLERLQEYKTIIAELTKEKEDNSVDSMGKGVEPIFKPICKSSIGDPCLNELGTQCGPGICLRENKRWCKRDNTVCNLKCTIPCVELPF